MLDPSSFPRSAPLDGLVRHDMRVNRYEAGEIVVREGDYGNSAFLILEGELLIARSPGIPEEQLGRSKEANGACARLKTLFSNANIRAAGHRPLSASEWKAGNSGARGAFLQGAPAIIEDGDIVRLSEGTFLEN